MRIRRSASILAGLLTLTLIGVLDRPAAQPLNELPPARAPCSVLSGEPCHPSFCDVFHLGPCFPQYLPPIGQDLRLTIVSTDNSEPAGGSAVQSAKSDRDTSNREATPDQGAASEQDVNEEKPLDSIGSIYDALRACWVPPPKGAARHGMEYTIRFAFKRDGEIIAPPRVTYASHEAPADVRDTYRDAVNAALARCTPLHFSKGMAGAVAGRPIAVRFVDNRSTDKPL